MDEAGDVRQVKVEQGDREAARPQLLKRAAAVGRGHDFETLARQKLGDGAAQGVIVFNEQDRLGHGLGLRSAKSG